MKKTIGIILFVIVGLNFIAIFVRMSKAEPIGSPMYIILLLAMIGGGIWLINKGNEEKEANEA